MSYLERESFVYFLGRRVSEAAGGREKDEKRAVLMPPAAAVERVAAPPKNEAGCPNWAINDPLLGGACENKKRPPGAENLSLAVEQRICNSSGVAAFRRERDSG